MTLHANGSILPNPDCLSFSYSDVFSRPNSPLRRRLMREEEGEEGEGEKGEEKEEEMVRDSSA